MDKSTLKDIIVEQNNDLSKHAPGIEREILKSIEKYRTIPHAVIISGLRRTGKSTLLTQIKNKYYQNDIHYFNFEDERLINFETSDFNNFVEILIELFGNKQIFFMDEIQNIDNWEIFVRRMQDKKYKFYITGSNASLLSKELGTKLTGRYIMTELFPFSFKEFLKFKKVEITANSLFDTKERAHIKHHFNEYLENGGLPEYLKYKDKSILTGLYENILYRDIVARYEIKEIKSLRELSFYYLSNIASLFSYNKLKNILQLGSINTVKNYTDYLENTFLFFTVSRFSYSLKQQFVAPKKIYCIDNGLIEFVSFAFMKNRGKFLENLVFLALKRLYNEIYYYKTENNLEIDFLIKQGKTITNLIQVTETLYDTKTRQREIDSLIDAMTELNVKESLILTFDDEETVHIKNKKIVIKPVYKWLLE